ncbi:PREDICTED: natural killer cell receptor 2B4-like isoform X2 [Cyprinodon variegatus]|uniref:natural killer cell receptor 2B4-like isoform X2 n=1 Tax=Cyprinodon variegatus TaxID=28743 RepID=UPI0007429705|nr:PREDICTED: natural killer cell receptor 2B4-like isoform X2 [Cyprinodon variegatus]
MAGGRFCCLLTYVVVLFLRVFLHDVEASGEKQVIDRKVGDSVELSSNLPTEGVSSARWRYGNSVVAYHDTGVTANNLFQGRVEFNNVSFSLTVRELTLQDSGDFQFISEANGQQRPTVTITLQVHEPISTKPKLVYNISEPDLNGSCTVYLECRAAPHRNTNYILTVGNQTHEGPKLHYHITTQDGDTTVTCNASNAVSEMSASETLRCKNSTDSLSNKGELPLVWILSAAGGCLLIIFIIIVVILCLCRRTWSGSDSNELTVYADISDFSPEVDTSANSKVCSLYDTVNDNAGHGQQMPQTIYDKIQIERMRKASLSPYQEIS